MKIEIKKAQELFREFLIARMNSDLDTTREIIKREHPYWIIEFGQRLLEEANKEENENPSSTQNLR